MHISRDQLLSCLTDLTKTLDLGQVSDSIFEDIDFNEFTNDQLINQIIIDAGNLTGEEKLHKNTLVLLKEFAGYLTNNK